MECHGALTLFNLKRVKKVPRIFPLSQPENVRSEGREMKQLA